MGQPNAMGTGPWRDSEKKHLSEHRGDIAPVVQSTSLAHVSSVDSRFRPTQVVSLLSPQQRTSHHSCDHHTNATHQQGHTGQLAPCSGPRRMTTAESTGGTPDLDLDGDDLGPFLSPAAGKTEKFAAQCALSEGFTEMTDHCHRESVSEQRRRGRTF